MHTIDSNGQQDGRFVGRDPDSGTPGTAITADWLNAIQEELTAVIAEAGIPLDKAKNNQLAEAIVALINDRVGQANQGALSEARVIELIQQHAMVWG